MRINQDHIRALLSSQNGDAPCVNETLEARFNTDLSGRVFKESRSHINPRRYVWVPYTQVPKFVELDKYKSMGMSEINRIDAETKRKWEEYCTSNRFEEKFMCVDFDHPDGINMYNDICSYCESQGAAVHPENDWGVGSHDAFAEGLCIFNGSPLVVVIRNFCLAYAHKSDEKPPQGLASTYTSQGLVEILASENRRDTATGLVRAFQEKYPSLVRTR